MPLVSEACRGDLGRVEERAAATLTALRRADERMKRLATRTEDAKAHATGLAEEADTLAREAERIEAEHDAVMAELNALVEEHGTTLPEPEYTRAMRLEARAAELEEDYAAAAAEYNAAAEEANSATDAANRLVAEHNAAADRRRRLAGVAARRERRYHAVLDGCLANGGGERWARRVAPLEEELGHAASTLAAVERVECDPFDEWRRLELREADPEHVLEGYVFAGETVIHLAPRVCHALAERLLEPAGGEACHRTSTRAGLDLCPPAAALLATSLETLAHEAMHADGVENEARATCYGIQHAVALGEAAFGLRRADARSLARYQLRFVQRPPEYRSRQCRKGGALDLSPQTPAWP